MVLWELFREGLHEVPSSLRSVSHSLCGVIDVATRVSAHQKRCVLFGDIVVYSKQGHGTGVEILGHILQSVIAKSNLHWLVDVQHVNLVVPRPFVQIGRIGVGMNIARAVAVQET